MTLLGNFRVEEPPENVPVTLVDGLPERKIPENEMNVAGLGFEAIILTLGVLGNLTLLIAIKRSPRLTTSIFQLIFALAIADVTYLSAVVGPHLLDYFSFSEQWLFGQAGCSVLTFLDSLVPKVSGLLLVACCWERYCAVCRPRSALSITSKRTTIIILVAWFLAAAASVPYLVRGVTAYKKYSDGTLIQTCTVDIAQSTMRIYLTAAMLIFYAVAGTVALTFLVCALCKAMRLDFDYDEVKDDFKNHILRCLALVTVSYLLLWLPSRILAFSHLHMAAPIDNPFFSMVARQMAAISGAVKPIIYAAASSQFRKSVLSALRCCSFCSGKPPPPHTVSPGPQASLPLKGPDAHVTDYDIPAVISVSPLGGPDDVTVCVPMSPSSSSSSADSACDPNDTSEKPLINPV